MLEINTPLMVLTVSALVGVQTFYPRAPRPVQLALALLTLCFALSFFFWKLRIPAGPVLKIAIMSAVAVLVAFNIAVLAAWARRLRR
jgi:hypothetical protein